MTPQFKENVYEYQVDYDGRFDELDIKYEITPVGDKNVADCMINNNYAIGGEDSGHIIYRYDGNFGDGLKTALLVFEALNHYGISLKEAVKDVTIFPQLLINERVTDKNSVLSDENINNEIKKCEEELGKNGRILVRPSGTEPLIRVMVEAESDELCKKYVDRVITKIIEGGYSQG